MNEIMNKLSELENAKECIEKCQKNLREEMQELSRAEDEQYFNKELIYMKNRDELKDINKKIEILNNAMDILEGIGV